MFDAAVERFVNKQRYFLKLELKAEEESCYFLMSFFNSFLKQVSYRDEFEYLTFEFDTNQMFPDISNGDKVFVRKDSQNSEDDEMEVVFTGFVSNIDEKTVTLRNSEFFKKSPVHYGIGYEIRKVRDYQNILNLLKFLSDVEYKDSLLKQIFFGSCYEEEVENTQKINFLNEDLNYVQRKAVELSMAQKRLAIIEGPPGTGKSTVIIEILRQCFLTEKKFHVVVCAPSHIPLDGLLEVFKNHSSKNILRFGNELKISEANVDFSMNAKIKKSSSYDRLCKLKQKIIELSEEGGPGKKKLRDKKSMQFQNLEEKIKREIIDESDVVFSTLSAAYNLFQNVKPNFFDLVIVDECGQALEILLMVPLFSVNKYIMAGDYHQLPPVVKSRRASAEGFNRSLLKKLIRLYPDKKTRLTIQYRMNEAIMKFPSNEFYDGDLIAHDSVRSHTLCELPRVKKSQMTSSPVILIDTASQFLENFTSLPSKINTGEAKVVRDCVELLISLNVEEKAIGVLTFYKGQTHEMRKVLSHRRDVEIKSVDSFQGREKEVIIISFVRSNMKKTVGFLTKYRRINVALTRARRLLILVMDTNTLSKNFPPFLKNMVEYYSRYHCPISNLDNLRTELKIEKSNNCSKMNFGKQLNKLLTDCAAGDTTTAMIVGPFSQAEISQICDLTFKFDNLKIELDLRKLKIIKTDG